MEKLGPHWANIREFLGGFIKISPENLSSVKTGQK
jgi:hypothetical protein